MVPRCDGIAVSRFLHASYYAGERLRRFAVCLCRTRIERHFGQLAAMRFYGADAV